MTIPVMAPNLYLGAMSGTSLDGLDLALCNFEDHSIVSKSGFYSFPNSLKSALFELSHSDSININHLYQTEQIYSKFCSNSILHFLKHHQISTNSIKALGIHGQTIRHEPNIEHAFTVQLADLSRIAAKTNLITIGDFRSKDIALNGQGAPLVPPFHNAVFSSQNSRIVANIGGIANITVLTPNQPSLGYDTGPGNALLDYWFSSNNKGDYDDQGNWARTGTLNEALLSDLLDTAYLTQTFPKSTGRELFNPEWLNTKLTEHEINKNDIQTTLVEFTAITLTNEIKKHSEAKEVFLCGGGWQNTYLVERIKHFLGLNYKVSSTSELGIEPDWLEASAFAWLAKNTFNKKDSNQASATGADRNAILGGIYYP